MVFDENVKKSVLYSHALSSAFIGIIVVLAYTVIDSHRKRVLFLHGIFLMAMLSLNSVSRSSVKLKEIQNVAITHFHIVVFYLTHIMMWRPMDAYGGKSSLFISYFHIMIGVMFSYGFELFSKPRHVTSSPILVFVVMMFFPINVFRTMSQVELIVKYVLFTAMYFALMYSIVFYDDFGMVSGRSYMFCSTIWILIVNPLQSTAVMLIYSMAYLIIMLRIIRWVFHVEQAATMVEAERI